MVRICRQVDISPLFKNQRQILSRGLGKKLFSFVKLHVHLL